MLPPLKVVHVEEAKTAAEKVKNASREGGKGVWNRQGQVTLQVANPVVVSTPLDNLVDIAGFWDSTGICASISDNCIVRSNQYRLECRNRPAAVFHALTNPVDIVEVLPTESTDAWVLRNRLEASIR